MSKASVRCSPWLCGLRSTQLSCRAVYEMESGVLTNIGGARNAVRRLSGPPTCHEGVYGTGESRGCAGDAVRFMLCRPTW